MATWASVRPLLCCATGCGLIVDDGRTCGNDMNLLVSPGNPPIHNPISMRKTPVVVFLFGCLVVPMNMPDGIDQLEPVGPFLNGTLAVRDTEHSFSL